MPDYSGAPCTQQDPEIWFDPDLRAVAVNLCRTCPVVTACLDESISDRNWPDTSYGVWGGLPANTRLGLRRKRNKARRDGIVTLPTTGWGGELARSSS